jgi:hypothetical protein
LAIVDNRGDEISATGFGMSAEAQAMRVRLSRQSIASYVIVKGRFQASTQWSVSKLRLLSEISASCEGSGDESFCGEGIYPRSVAQQP